MLTSGFESVAFLALVLRQGARCMRRLTCATRTGHSLLSVLPPKKLRERTRHRRVSMSLGDVGVVCHSGDLGGTQARPRRDTSAPLPVASGRSESKCRGCVPEVTG